MSRFKPHDIFSVALCHMKTAVRISEQKQAWLGNTGLYMTVPMKGGHVSPTTRLVQMCRESCKSERIAVRRQWDRKEATRGTVSNTAEHTERLTSWFPRYQHPRSRTSKAEETLFHWVTALTMWWKKNADALISSTSVDCLRTDSHTNVMTKQ